MAQIRTAVAVTLALTLGHVLAAQSPVTRIDDGALDHIELFVPAIERSADLTVLIKPFDASGASLGTGGEGGKDTRKEEARTMQHEGPRVLAERFVAALTKDGRFKTVRVLEGTDPVPAATLLVEGTFVTIDPGSRAKRYFGGFGAGKSSVKVAGTVKDATGKTLATFEQQRVGAMGIAGGDSLGKMMSDARSIGEDIAGFLAKWARGQDLK
jgi:hypothetical protein